MTIEDEFDARFIEMKQWAEKHGLGLLMVAEHPEDEKVYMNFLVEDAHPVIGQVMDDIVEHAQSNGGSVQHLGKRAN